MDPKIPQRESELLTPLLRWLQRRRQLPSSACVVGELPWSGRWVDLAVLTPSGSTLAFELKLRHNARAIEQAALNSRAFDRSYVVTAAHPGQSNIAEAQSFGIGLVVISPGLERVRLIQAPTSASPSRVVRQRLRSTIREAAEREGKCLLPTSVTT